MRCSTTVTCVKVIPGLGLFQRDEKTKPIILSRLSSHKTNIFGKHVLKNVDHVTTRIGNSVETILKYTGKNFQKNMIGFVTTFRILAQKCTIVSLILQMYETCKAVKLMSRK